MMKIQNDTLQERIEELEKSKQGYNEKVKTLSEVRIEL